MTDLGCYKDVNFTDVPFNTMTSTAKLTASNMGYCYYACSSQGFMYMAIQNSTTCACGYQYGQYGQVNSSLCSQCNGYNCGGNGVNGITYMNFFQLTLICPLFVMPGETFTCTVQMSFNLPIGQTIVDPFALTVYPTYESTYDYFEIEGPLPLGVSNSFAYNSTVLTTQFNYTYNSARTSRTIYIYPDSYYSSYTQQVIYVVPSNCFIIYTLMTKL